MTRSEALAELAKHPYQSEQLKDDDFNFLADYLAMTRKEFDDLMALPGMDHYDYPVSRINRLAGLARRFRKYLGTSG